MEQQQRLTANVSARRKGSLGGVCAPARASRRRQFMLDDGVLLFDSFDTRRYLAWRVFAFYVCCFLTCGILLLLSSWDWFRKPLLLWMSVVARPQEAEFAVVTGADGSYEVCRVEPVEALQLEMLPLDSSERHSRLKVPPQNIPLDSRMIVYRHSRFVLSPDGVFTLLDCDICTTTETPRGGLSDVIAAERLKQFGHNVIDIPVPPWWILLGREASNPFTVFQVWAIAIWVAEEYYSFTIFIAITVAFTTVSAFWETRKNLLDIQRLSRYTTPVRVFRGGSALPITIDSKELVPGDLLVIEQGMKLPADCVLIAGQVTVNEAMLTGEATVVSKQPTAAGCAPNAAEPRNTLFGGSIVVQLRVKAEVASAGVLAVVVRTGFDSVKGRLVLSILYPQPAHFEFMRQALVFLLLLAILAVVGFAVNVKALIDACASVGKIILRGCDMVTVVVPPSLPLALTVGTAYALIALRRNKIYCIAPPRINLAGKINCFCFDKTGTLTSEGLELACVRPVLDTSTGVHFSESGVTDCDGLPPRFVALLASCHSLTHVSGSLTGDPLEIKTFAFTGAVLDEPHHPAPQASSLQWTSVENFTSRVLVQSSLSQRCSMDSVGSAGWRAIVLHQFDFVPALQRMGVVVLEEDGTDIMSFVKGSPEAIASLCIPATLPPDFWQVLASYTHLGYRVLGAAWKNVPAASLPSHGSAAWSTPELRTSFETGLTFLGFIVLENQLKPASKPAITALRDQAGLALAMITGDNADAAVCVGRRCEIVEPGFRVFIGDLAPTSITTKAEPLAPPTGVADNAEDDSLMGDLIPRDAVASVSLASSAGASGPVHDLHSSQGNSLAPQSSVVWTDVDDASLTLDPIRLTPVARGHGDALTSYEPYRLALTGRAFAVLLDAHRRGADPQGVFRRAILNGSVFARMSPEAKASLIEEFQATGLYVGMVGDGANDNLALRAAHVGISLSQVEASVSAPFTSHIPDVSCVARVLCEGRGALATSFGLFQFMAMYSTIQFVNVLLAVWRGSLLSNAEFMWQDLFIVFVLSISLGRTASSNHLTKKRPSGRLLSAYNLVLLGGFIVLTVLWQAVAFVLVQQQWWYGSQQYPAPALCAQSTDIESTNSAIPETTSIYLMASLQFVAVAIVFSNGYPWKKPAFSNGVFTSWLCLVAFASVALFFLQNEFIYSALDLQILPLSWNAMLFGLSIGSFLSYFGFVAIMVFFWRLRRSYTFSLTTKCRSLCPARKLKPHKQIRRMWQRLFASELPIDEGSHIVVGFPSQPRATWQTLGATSTT